MTTSPGTPSPSLPSPAFPASPRTPGSAAHAERPAPSLGSQTRTGALSVTVEPRYVPEHSDPSHRKHIFVYRVRMTNHSAADTLRVLSRRWLIIDAAGKEHLVEGEGVVGQQPTLEPGQSFEYESWCPLSTPWGTMQGAYRVRNQDGEEFDAAIARFYLVSE